MYDDIVKYIPYGRENAISRDDLAIKVGCSDRIMRDLISKARKKTVIINIQNGSGYYRPTENDMDYLETLEGKNLPVEHCIYGTEGWRIIPELVDDCKEYPDCSFIDKVTFGYENWKDIFGTVDEYGIELVGLCTDICVVSNALALRMFYPSWNISVDESCCAGVTTKKHKAALEVMKSCQIEVTNSQKTK